MVIHHIMIYKRVCKEINLYTELITSGKESTPYILFDLTFKTRKKVIE